MSLPASADERRARLARARVMLLFTPAVVPHGDPLAALRAALPWVDVVQVRVKPPGAAGNAASGPPASALETRAWTERVLALRAELASAALVLVNDRVDVARLLAAHGADGVHLGQDDFPPAEARAWLGPGALIGLSTHDAQQLARAAREPVDYLGFGPIWPSATKGYERGLGPRAARVAARSAEPRPLFPIGGIDASNAAELAPVGRAAVCAAILAAPDPGSAARALRLALEKVDEGAP